MAVLDDVGGLSQLWGSAVAAWSDPQLRARPGGAVQYLWGAYSNAVGAGLITPEADAFSKMNQLSSAAARVASSSLRLMDAARSVEQSGLDQAMTPAFSAPDIDHQGVTVSPFEGSARVRIQADVLAGGMPLSQWYTWRPGLEMPQTVGALMDSIDVVLQGFAEDYGLDDISLGATVTVTFS